MRERHLSKLVRLTLLPAFAVSVAMSATAETGSSAGKTGTEASAARPHGQQKSGMQQGTLSYRGLRASEMIDMSVRNEQGDNIGQIEDLIVNLNTGDVRYAMLRFDPGILAAEKLFAVPTTELRMAPDRNDLVYVIDEERLEQAAADRDDWDKAEGAVASDEVRRFDKAWGIAQPADGARAHRASELIGRDVETPSGENIGEVEELVINMAEQKVHYAVLAFDPSWASPERNYAFPLRSFRLGADNALTLDIAKSQLQAMKSFPDSRYADLNDRVWIADIDRYFILPVFTGRGTMAAADDAGTSGAAGGTAADGATAGTGANTAATPSATATPETNVNTVAGGGTGATAPYSQFSQLDENGDRSLSRQEVSGIGEVEGAWQRLDKDGDDRISEAEFTREHGSAAPAR